MRSRLLYFLLLAAVVVSAAPRASAVTLPINGGPGLDQGEICLVGSLCPGTPTFSLAASAAVTGSFTYNVGPGTVDFTITLLAPASFGLPSLLAGSTFSATGVPVISTPLGGGAVLITQFGLASAVAAPLFLAPAFPIVANTPDVSGLSCTIGTGADQCGVNLGAAGLRINAGGFGTYDAFLGFNVNVPEPGTMMLLAAGLAGIAAVGRKRG